jgi:signal transduction histidine kinase/CheY-like chemotaxis protein
MRRLVWETTLFTAAILVAMHSTRATAQPNGEVLRIGLYQNEPKIFRNADGEPTGLFVDLLDAVAERENWSLRYVDCNWPDCLVMLEAGELDLMPDVALTPERAQRVQFNDIPALDSFSRVYAREYANIQTEADLGGQRIAVLRGSMQSDALRQQAQGLDEPIELVTAESFDEAFNRVADGAADGAVANNFFGARAAQAHGLVPTPVILLPAQLYFAAPPDRGAAHLEAIDTHLEQWRNEGGSPYYAALSRWTRTRPPDGMARWLKIALGIACLFLVIGFLAIQLLRREVARRTGQLEVQNRKLHQRQDDLEESQARSQGILEGLPIPTCVWRRRDDGFELEVLNRTAADLLEADRSEWEGKSLGELYATDHPLKAAVERCFDSRESERTETEMQLRDGAPLRHCVLTTGFIPPESVLVHVEDVTEHLALEHRLQVKRRMETAGMLAGGVAHDFNNLLTVINSTAQLALDDATDPRLREELSQILLAGEKAADVTARLLAFSRDEVVEPTLMRLSEGVRQALALLDRLIEESVRVEADLVDGGDWVVADPTQIQQIVMNLVVNARDALEHRGSIRVSTEVDLDARTVLLRVADDGEGMDEETMNRIFDPFFTTKERDRGTGLGLAIVYGAVEQANGSVDVDSTPGEGTTITVTFPLSEGDDAVDTAPDTESAEPASGRILLVEDDSAVRMVAQRILEREGYQVIAAESVGHALELADGDLSPALLLTDIVMPEKSGIELAAEIRRRHPSIRILLMSGYTDAQLTNHGALGTYAVVSKPFSPRELAAHVRELLEDTATQQP